MSCNNLNHSYLCNCDKTGIVIPITIDKTKCISYNNLYAMPMDKDMIDEFNGYITKAGGLENACIKYPYVIPYVDRYGLMHTPDADFSCYTNLFHILLMQERDNAWKTAKKGPTYNTFNQERFSNGLSYSAPIEKQKSCENNEKNIEFSKLYDFKQESKKDVNVNLRDIGENDEVKPSYSFDAKHTINSCNNPVKGKQTYLMHHPNDPRVDEQQSRGFMNRPILQWQGSQPSMWQSNQPVQYPSWDTSCAVPQQYAQQPLNPALAMEQQALYEQTTPRVTIGGVDMTSKIIGTPSIQPTNLNIVRPNQSLFSNEDYARAENQINQSINNESWMAENEFPSEEEACYQPSTNPYIQQQPMYSQQQYASPYNRFAYQSFANVDEFGLPTRYIPQRNNRWMRPTREEIRSGKAPLVGVCINGKETANVEKIIKLNEERDKLNEKKFKESHEPRVAIVRKHIEEDGLEWHEYLGGNKDIIITKEKAIAQKTFDDYKMGATNLAAKKQEEDTYKLAKELRRYNQELADELLWYQNNVNFDEFIEMKRECQNQLIEYRNNDPVSSAKSSVIIAGDTTLIKEPRPLTDKQLKDMRTNFKSQKDKDDDLIENTIKKYSMDYIKFDTQDKTIFSNDSVDNKIEKLQTINNLKVIPLEKDKAYNKMNEAIKNLTPIKVTQKDRYILWKRLIRGSKVISNQNIDNFDKEFDDWWNKPRIKNREEFNEKYLERMHQLHYEYLVLVNRMQPTPEQIKQANESIIASEWRKFDQGSCTKDMTTYQFMKNLGFLETRIIEQDIQQQKYQLRRRYDPEAYKALSRECSAKQNYLDGKGYVATIDLMDQKVYNKKRQLFIDQIFKKAHRGTIT